MLNIREKCDLDRLLANSNQAKKISFCLQKDEISEKFPNAILPTLGQSFYEYVFYLLHRFPISMLVNPYLEECVMYLCEQENHYLVSCTKELYPEIAKLHNSKKMTDIERSLRYFISSKFLAIPEELKKELFAVPDGFIPTNFFFLINLVDYIKSHYFACEEKSISLEQKEYFLSNIKEEDNAFLIIKRAELRKQIGLFLYEKLGHFRYSASLSQQILIELLMYSIENGYYSLQDAYTNSKLHNWGFNDYTEFKYMMFTTSVLRATLVQAYRNVNFETYKQIFGDCDLHKGVVEYIQCVSDYLREQDFVRSLRK